MGGPGSHELELLEADHAIHRLDPAAEAPAWAQPADGAILSVTRTASELSIVCADHLGPAGLERSGPWRALRVAGTLDHSLVGVLSALAAPLADAGIPIFAISTFDTDYLLVGAADVTAAAEALRSAGHSVAAAG